MSIYMRHKYLHSLCPCGEICPNTSLPDVFLTNVPIMIIHPANHPVHPIQSNPVYWSCQYRGWPPRTAAVGVYPPEPRVLQMSKLEKWSKPFGGVTPHMCKSQTLEQEGVKLKLPWRPQDDARAMDTCWGKLLTGSGTTQKKKKICCSQWSRKEFEIWRMLLYQTWRCRVCSLPSWFSVLFWSSISSLFGMYHGKQLEEDETRARLTVRRHLLHTAKWLSGSGWAVTVWIVSKWQI